MTTANDSESRERDDLIEALGAHRNFLRQTVRDLNAEQIRQRTTVSELCLGGIIKHVTLVEERWADFIEKGPERSGPIDQAAMEAHAATFRVLEGESLEVLLERYAEVARRSDQLLRTIPSLDSSQPLPEAPWFKPGSRWTARYAFLHILAETAQHAGHADIIREALDGAKTMG